MTHPLRHKRWRSLIVASVPTNIHIPHSIGMDFDSRERSHNTSTFPVNTMKCCGHPTLLVWRKLCVPIIKIYFKRYVCFSIAKCCLVDVKIKRVKPRAGICVHVSRRLCLAEAKRLTMAGNFQTFSVSSCRTISTMPVRSTNVHDGRRECWWDTRWWRVLGVRFRTMDLGI